MDNVQKGSKLVPVLVVLLIVASFVIGMLFTQIKLLEKKTSTTAAAAQGDGQVAAGNNNAGNQPTQPQVLPSPIPVNIDITGAHIRGDKDAKVAVVEFTDYQCPYCGQVVTNSYPQINKGYVDTGKVKHVVFNFPLFQIHPYAQKAAEAAECAADQNKFWEMHDKMFANQTALTVDDLKKYATELGLNTTSFSSCVESGKYTDKVKKEQAMGEKFGVRGTPDAFVGIISGNTVKNAVEVSGAVPFESFKSAIDEALKKA